jgi:DNA-binding NarL/FixJ family response regulator
MYTDKTRHISIVEDNHAFQHMLKDFFERKFPGITVHTYSTGEEFLEKYTYDSDAVLLDFNLDSVNRAAMNGLQTLKTLKQRDPYAQVIFLSSNDSAELADSVITNGAYHYIVKNEHAFGRLEIILRNLFHQTGISKNLKTQRFFNTVLLILLVLVLIGLIFYRLGM